MARLMSSGFESNSLVAGVEITSILSTPTIVTSPVRSGTYALEINGLVTGTQKSITLPIRTASTAPLYCRFYFYLSTLPSTTTNIANFGNGGLTSSNISLNASGQLLLRNFSTTIGSPTAALSLNQWYRVEWYADASPANGSQVITGRLNGTQFATSSILTISNSSTGDVRFGGNVGSDSSNAGLWYFDDIAVNDTTGLYQNSWAGDGSIIHLKPNAAGDNNAWLDTAGSAGTSNNYTLVDENPPNDVTDYVQSRVTDQIDDYNIEDTSGSVASKALMNVVQVGVRFSRSGGTTSSQVVPRLKGASGGTVEEGAAINASSSTWLSHKETSPRIYDLTSYVVPGTSVMWSKSALDTAQIGVRISTGSGDRYVWVSTLWALVEYTSTISQVSTDLIDIDFNPPAGGSITLVVADAYHTHTVDNVDLTSKQTLVVAETSHTHLADNVVVTQITRTTLVVNDTLHSHLADGIALTSKQTLIVAETLHTHISDNVVLIQDFQMAVADTLHSHDSDNITLTYVPIVYPVYSYTNTGTLPTNDANVATPFDSGDYTEALTNDSVYVTSLGNNYNVFVFKDATLDPVSLVWNGKTTKAPATATVYLQIYNYNTSTWETVDSDNTSSVDTDFTLNADIASVTDYLSDGHITCRVYQ